MLREASAPSEGEGEAPGKAVLWSDLSGAHRGPGVGTTHRAHLGIMAGLQVPDVPLFPTL